MRSHSSYLFGIGHPLLVDFGLCAPIRLVFFDIGHLLLVNFDLYVGIMDKLVQSALSRCSLSRVIQPTTGWGYTFLQVT